MRKWKPREVKLLGPGHTASNTVEPGFEPRQAGFAVCIFNYNVDRHGERVKMSRDAMPTFNVNNAGQHTAHRVISVKTFEKAASNMRL